MNPSSALSGPFNDFIPDCLDAGLAALSPSFLSESYFDRPLFKSLGKDGIGI